MSHQAQPTRLPVTSPRFSFHNYQLHQSHKEHRTSEELGEKTGCWTNMVNKCQPTAFTILLFKAKAYRP